MMSILRHLDIGAVVIIGITLLLFLTISKTSNGTLQHPDKMPNKMPNKIMVKRTAPTGQGSGEVGLRVPEALLVTLQEGDLTREIPAPELRVPTPLLFHLQRGKSADASPLSETPADF